MRRVIRGIALLTLAHVPVVLAQDVAQTVHPALGDWLGTIDAGVAQLRIALTIERAQNGELEATFNSVDQGASVQVDSIAFEGGVLSFAVPSVQGTYEGRLQPEGRRIEGTWRQVGSTFPLTFERLDEPFVLRRPQNPEPPFPYESRDVEIRNERSEISLACTLVVPSGGQPGGTTYPAVLMLTGSGAQDRDETLMGHRPFWVIADHLARRSIASLRCDDRGVGGSEGNVFLSSLDEQAADAEAAVRFLTMQPEIAEVGLIGHSEGALLAPIVASRGAAVDFLVLLAAPAVPMDELMMRQARDLMAVRGVDPSLIDRALSEEAEELALVQSESISRDQLIDSLQARAADRREELTASELEALSLTEQTTERAIQQVATPWFRSLLRQDPAAFLGRLDVPVLALFGAKDLQVAADVNAPAMERALDSAPTSDYTVRTIPDLNHLFQHAETGATDEYGRIEETFAPEALTRIADWITERTTP
ncbi:MAG: alpha/beta hydrolase family protein [Gemmatimonadales bacterium]